MRRALLLALLALAGCGGAAGPEEAAPAGPQALVEELQRGGHVLYLRHAATDLTEQDVAGAPLADCGRQRNLTAAGREQARTIGRALRELGITVAEVVSSEYCRCLETARLAFGRAKPEPLLSGLPGSGEEGYDERVAALRGLLSEPPPAGANRLVVRHVKNLEAAAKVEVDEGGTAVFEPLGADGFRLARRLPAEAWPQLADALGGG